MDIIKKLMAHIDKADSQSKDWFFYYDHHPSFHLVMQVGAAIS